MFGYNTQPQNTNNNMGGFGLGSAIGGAVSGIMGGVATGMQMNNAKIDRRFAEQMQQQQFENQQALNQQAYDLNYRMWEETNAEAQMEQLKKAGLNPALIYGKQGAGGTTGGQSGGSASAGQTPQTGAPLGMVQAGAAIADIIANAKLKEAQANNLNKDAEVKEVQKGNIEADTGLKEANTLNVKSQTRLNNLAYDIGEATKEDQIDEIIYRVEGIIKQNDLTEAEAERARKDTLLKGVQARLAESNIDVNNQKINEMINNVAQEWERLEQGRIGLQIQNLGVKGQLLAGQTKLQEVKNNYLIDQLRIKLGMMNLNIEQQKIFTSMFNGLLGAGKGGGTTETYSKTNNPRTGTSETWTTTTKK